jgi:hypothetical protein
MGRGGAQGGIEGQIAHLVTLRQAGLDVPAALAVGLGARPPAGLLARQPVELGVEPAWGKLRRTADLLAAFPPVGVVRGFGDGLWAGLMLGDFGPVGDLFVLA